MVIVVEISEFSDLGLGGLEVRRADAHCVIARLQQVRAELAAAARGNNLACGRPSIGDRHGGAWDCGVGLIRDRSDNVTRDRCLGE
jgi:hypothetical protein